MTSTQPPSDSDLTVIPQSTQQIGSSFINQSSISHSENILAMGTALGEFEIIDIIGWGGFGIVYLAYDHSLHRQVALKEYMPSELAIRSNNSKIDVKSEQHRETFQAGLRSFINEARLLAHFDHPSLVKVYRFWEDNGTAYMVMPFYQGMTLKETLRDMSKLPDEAWLKNLLSQLLDALSVLHKDKCLHRDIAPDNILILPDGRPLLLDFGAARHVISDMTQSLTVILKPGYAPIEQYADVATMTQGPWTDIYALAAVIYFAITGKPPIPSVSRIISDTLTPLRQAAENQYNFDFLSSIDQALAVKPENRPQNVGAFHALLNLKKPRTEPVNHFEIFATASTEIPNTHGSNESKKPLMLYLVMLIIFTAIIWISISHLDDKKTEQLTAQSTVNTSIASEQETTFDPLKALDEVFEGRDRTHAITVSVEKAQARINKDLLHFKVRSAKPGFVYVLAVGTNHTDFLLLFPNVQDKNNHIKANQQIGLPRDNWKMIAHGPSGTNHFIVIVSNQPRDFSSLGLQVSELFGELLSDRISQLYHAYKGTVPFFAGRAVCSSSDLFQDCPESYGAAMFSIEEIE